MESERSAIIELHMAGKSPSEILKLLNNAKGRRAFIYRTINRYKETGDTVDKPRSGRPYSVTTSALKKVVRERIRRNPHRSMRKMALELNISRRAIQKVVKRDLGMRSFKRKKVQFLSGSVKEKRVSRSKSLLALHAIGVLENTIFSDEKIFTIEEATNSQNDRVISASVSAIPDKFRYISRMKKPLSVMVWAGVSAVGRTPLIFIPPGVKINAKTYQELVLEPVVKGLSQTMFSGQQFVFQQDGAPAHTANTTQDWLKHNIPNFIHKDEWPPYSPDLNPMDYSVWSILENKACSVSHNTVSSLKISLCREWEKIPQETLRAAVEGFRTDSGPSFPKRVVILNK
ncbi:MhmaT1 transposase [Oopsacas minuta]|uniref:MhmaT1 transposase n=1 Tax=Oopsacas minuta TaxID=111878 RepID=A0AAV7JJX0_9METZ|nr:MhmaT1 transposase [Oopsacas minuta]